MTEASVLVCAPEDRHADYASALSGLQMKLTTRPSWETSAPDLIVLDCETERAWERVTELRQRHRGLLILLVDDAADFAFPGLADDISTTPFEHDDLRRRIRRLLEERRMETLRADVMPPIREIGRRLRSVAGVDARAQVIVEVCLELGFTYAAVYRLNAQGETAALVCERGDGSIAATPAHHPGEDDAIAATALTGQSIPVSPAGSGKHPLVEGGSLQSGAAVAIGSATRFGVLFAGKASQNLSAQDILLLELIAAQAAALITKA
jgi:hypothetical protein